MKEFEMRKYSRCDANNIAMIAAMAKNRVIGREGKIPWDLPEDREHFKQLTMGHVVVMGRHTYEEIGRPLPGVSLMSYRPNGKAGKKTAMRQKH